VIIGVVLVSKAPALYKKSQLNTSKMIKSSTMKNRSLKYMNKIRKKTQISVFKSHTIANLTLLLPPKRKYSLDRILKKSNLI
jgi:hypothetical protein